MNDSDSSSENGLACEDLQVIHQVSQIKIAEDTRKKMKPQRASLEKLESGMKAHQASDSHKVILESPAKIVEVAEKQNEDSEGLLAKTSRSRSATPSAVRKMVNDTKKSMANLKAKLDESSGFKPVDQACPSKPKAENKRISCLYSQEKSTGRGLTVLKVEGAFSKKISIRKDVGRDQDTKKKLELADAMSDDEEASIETVKKQSASKKKQKTRHKISVCVLNQSEGGLIKHFLDAGEWRKVSSPDEAVFTFICNERKLDWDLSLKSMINKAPGVSFLARKRELSYVFNKYTRLYYGDGGMPYFPETFLLPEQLADYKRVHKVASDNQKHKDRVYISKTNRGSQGTGIKIIYSPTDLNMSKTTFGEDPEKVIQRYIKKPLLINGLKHDLRLYLLIANVDPLIAFINEEGLARFCTTAYEAPNHEAKNKDKNAHLTNFSLNKSSPNFKHTDELIEENEGSKQTLSSYWKALENRGMDVRKIKAEIIKLNQTLLQAMKPFLVYFQKCIFPRSEPGKYFHVIGVDILLDSKCRPWILEINASPSLNIDSTVVEEKSVDVVVTNNPLKHRPDGKKKFSVSNVDLHVKSMVLGHAVKLCKKTVDKIEDYEEYDSYTQIYSPEVEEKLFAQNNLYDRLLQLFIELSGPRFYPSLTASKFVRISKVLKDLGCRSLNKVELEVCFKKTLEFHEQMDFYAFIDCIELICSKIFPPDTPLKDAIAAICDSCDSFKKPLFYF